MCFKTAMEKEIQLKPWSHATELAESSQSAPSLPFSSSLAQVLMSFSPTFFTEGEAWDKILNNKIEELARIF